MNYYQKEALSTPLQVGVYIPWIVCPKDTGIVATESPEIIAALESCIARRKGGVTRIEEAQFEDAKKNPASRLPKPQWKPSAMPPMAKLSSSVFGRNSGDAVAEDKQAAKPVSRRETPPALASLADELAGPPPGGPPTRLSVMAPVEPTPSDSPSLTSLSEPLSVQPEPVQPPQAPAKRRGRPRKTVSQPGKNPSQSDTAS